MWPWQLSKRHLSLSRVSGDANTPSSSSSSFSSSSPCFRLDWRANLAMHFDPCRTEIARYACRAPPPNQPVLQPRGGAGGGTLVPLRGCSTCLRLIHHGQMGWVVTLQLHAYTANYESGRKRKSGWNAFDAQASPSDCVCFFFSFFFLIAAGQMMTLLLALSVFVLLVALMSLLRLKIIKR